MHQIGSSIYRCGGHGKGGGWGKSKHSYSELHSMLSKILVCAENECSGFVLWVWRDVVCGPPNRQSTRQDKMGN